MCSSKQSHFLWIAAFAVGFLGPKLPSACAQAESLADWTAKEYAQPLKRTRVPFSGLGPALHNGVFNDAADEQPFTDYYEKWIFPAITDLKLERGSRDDAIAQLRGAFRQLDAHPGSPVSEKLTDITLEYMPKIALDGKWHPAVRVNAVLAMGEVKSPKTVTVLLDLIRKKELHTTFKVAAMADLVQMAEHGVLADPTVAEPVVALMAGCAARATPADKKPSDSLCWMRGQAADVLGAVGSTGRNNEVFDALLLVLSDEKLPLLQRGKAARALGRLKYENGIPNQKRLCEALAGFGSDAFEPNLPLDVRRVRGVAREILDGLSPFLTQGQDAAPKAVHDLHDAMNKLDKVASKAQPNPEKPPVAKEDFEDGIAAAKAVCDGAAGKKPAVAEKNR